jgi:hypothetical protein
MLEVITNKDLEEWFAYGKSIGAIRMKVMSDSMSMEYYPIYDMSDDNTPEPETKFVKVKQVFDLSKPIDAQ